MKQSKSSSSTLAARPQGHAVQTVGGAPSAERPPVDKAKISWGTTIAMALFHVGALAAPFFFTWQAVIGAALLCFMTLSWGIGMGYHRLHTHRSYKVPLWFEYVLAVFGTLTLEGGPIFWVATHRVHHQLSDQVGDPHSPRDGSWWSHMGWIIFGESKHADTAQMARYAPELGRDPFYRWLNSFHWVPMIGLAIVLYLIGGWPMIFWGIFFRVTAGLHFTWLVNSASHLWGSRRFSTDDDSRNNWWVALVTFGEGWHNNHHAHPTSSRHGLAWYELDVTWLQIRALQLVGFAKAVKTATVNSPLFKRRVA
ncbi:MAG: acyl-CoA desaturase [Acidobacteria bacterium]|nr:acyl-CoA desaturase [Acidobacteriota bacterium]